MLILVWGQLENLASKLGFWFLLIEHNTGKTFHTFADWRADSSEPASWSKWVPRYLACSLGADGENFIGQQAYAKYGSKRFMGIISFSPRKEPYDIGGVISPILQMRKLRYREVKKPAHGQSAIRNSNLGWLQNLCPWQLHPSLSRHYPFVLETILGDR